MFGFFSFLVYTIIARSFLFKLSHSSLLEDEIFVKYNKIDFAINSGEKLNELKE